MQKRFSGVALFVLFLLQITVFYRLIQVWFPTGVVFKTLLDDGIPFFAPFIIPYLLFFFALFLPFAVSFRNKRTFFALSATFFFTSVVSNIVYILFQTSIARPEIVPQTIFEKLVLIVYAADAPLNLFPSGHVTFSVLANMCLFSIRKRLALAVLPLTASIALSTLFIKQHHIPDVLGGIALAFLAYRFLFLRLKNN